MSEPIAHLADDRLTVSLDFGTTFSGVAYVYNIPDKKPDVVAILEWPGERFPPIKVMIVTISSIRNGTCINPEEVS